MFSAAPLRVGGRDVGYVYVVLLGEAHDQLNARGSKHAVLTTALWSIAMVAFLCLVAGLTAFTFITRPLRRLTQSVRGFDINGPPPELLPPPAIAVNSRDEIAVLDGAYRQMVGRIGEQWRALTRQDQERRELIANVSHDLRTPLSSLHGYLETLLLKDATLEPGERRRYLHIAIDQSRKVGELAQSLFELARLEYGFVQPDFESFSMVDLVQDVFQKFELRAESRQVALKATRIAIRSATPVLNKVGSGDTAASSFRQDRGCNLDVSPTHPRGTILHFHATAQWREHENGRQGNGAKCLDHQQRSGQERHAA